MEVINYKYTPIKFYFSKIRLINYKLVYSKNCQMQPEISNLLIYILRLLPENHQSECNLFLFRIIVLGYLALKRDQQRYYNGQHGFGTVDIHLDSLWIPSCNIGSSSSVISFCLIFLIFLIFGFGTSEQNSPLQTPTQTHFPIFVLHLPPF